MSFLEVPKVDARGRVIDDNKMAPRHHVSKWCIDVELHNAAKILTCAKINITNLKFGNNLGKPPKSALKCPTAPYAADVVAIPAITVTDPNGATVEYIEPTTPKVTFADRIRIAKIPKNNGTVDFATRLANYYNTKAAKINARVAKVGTVNERVGTEKVRGGGKGFELLCVRMEKSRMLRVEGGRAVRASAAVKLSGEGKLGETLGKVKRGSEVAMVEGFGKMWL